MQVDSRSEVKRDTLHCEKEGDEFKRSFFAGVTKKGSTMFEAIVRKHLSSNLQNKLGDTL